MLAENMFYAKIYLIFHGKTKQTCSVMGELVLSCVCCPKPCPRPVRTFPQRSTADLKFPVSYKQIECIKLHFSDTTALLLCVTETEQSNGVGMSKVQAMRTFQMTWFATLMSVLLWPTKAWITCLCWSSFLIPKTFPIVFSQTQERNEGDKIPRVLNHCQGSKSPWGDRKVPTMSQVLSSIQYICFQKTSG